jgi:hypothetical protein
MATVEYPGPFSSHVVVVNGWQVPYLNATPLNGGRVHLNLDHRFGVDLTIEEAERVVPFLADCLAVALGYTCHPGLEVPDPPRRKPFTRMRAISSLEES